MLPITSPYRGMAAACATPVSQEDKYTLEQTRQNIIRYNCDWESTVFYRGAYNDEDIVEPLYRWDERPYNIIFASGFLPRPRDSTTLYDYYNLERHVNNGGAPVGPMPATGSIFVSTTRSTQWRPSITTDTIIYRYEIFAPGGVDTVQTMGTGNRYRSQQEIAFAGGINRQYIRLARAYNVQGRGRQFPIYTPYGNRIWRNGNFNPNPEADNRTSDEFTYRLRNVVCPNRGEFMINIVFTSDVQKREIRDGASYREEPYGDSCCGVKHHVECAFNTNDNNEEAFIFTGDQCLQMNYVPNTTKDYIIKGPMNIDDFFPFLKDTIFATGIDAAFTSYTTEDVYIFRSNLYALINVVRGYIVGGPKKITDGFHSFKNTIFEHGIDAAFPSSRENEAYIFKGDKYACIDFAPATTKDRFLTPPTDIGRGFPSLKGTIFQNGLDAAFTVKFTDEAYIFKGDAYAHINYAPHTTKDYIINKVSPISDGFHSLKGIIPRYPCN